MPQLGASRWTGGKCATVGTALLNLAVMQGIVGRGTAYRCDGHWGPHTRGGCRRESRSWRYGGPDDGDLEVAANRIRRIISVTDVTGCGIYGYQPALVSIWLGRLDQARGHAAAAEVALGSSLTSVFVVAAMVASWRLCPDAVGMVADAMRVAADALSTPTSVARDEAALEMGSMLVDFGALEAAEGDPRQHWIRRTSEEYLHLQKLPYGFLHFVGQTDGAAALVDQLIGRPYSDIAGRLRTQVLLARVHIGQGSPSASESLHELLLAWRMSSVLALGPAWCAFSTQSTSQHASGPRSRASCQVSPTSCQWLLEELASNLHRIERGALVRIGDEARHRPERWRSALRLVIAEEGEAEEAAAGPLSEIGGDEDAALPIHVGRMRRRIKPHAVAITQKAG